MKNWKRVTEAMPEQDVDVLLFWEDGIFSMEVGVYSQGGLTGWQSCARGMPSFDNPPSHWMHLPNEPKDRA